MKKILYFSLISSFIFSTFVFTPIVLADANGALIENGGFELPVIDESGGWGLRISDDVTGWTVEWTGATPGDPLLEIHHNYNNPYEGDQYIELDSNAPIRVYQDFDTCTGGTYEVSYAWAPRQGRNSAIKVYWDGVEIGNHSGTGAGGALNWTLTTSSQTAPDTSVRLSIEEVGPADSYGMYFDDVVVEEVWCPDITPPVITFEQPLDGSTHSGVIGLRATCNEVCDYVNFWWRAEGEPFAWYRYHYVHDDGTVFEWDLNTLAAQLADSTSYLMVDGTYYLYAAGKDLAGNWARTPDIMVIVDNTAPDQVDGMTILQNSVDIGCGAFVNERTITVDWNDSTDPNFDYFRYQADDGQGSIDFTTTLVPSERSGNIRDLDGTYQYRVQAVDLAGNTGPWSDWCFVTLDRQAPELTFLGFRDQDSSTYDDTEEIRPCGSVNTTRYIAWEWELNNAEPGTVNYYYEIISGPTAVGWSKNTFNTHHNGGIPMVGKYVVQVTATDQAGNISDPIECSVIYIKQLTLSPLTGHNPVGSEHMLTADIGALIEGVEVLFEISGPNAGSGVASTDENGEANYPYTGNNPGMDTITACIDKNGNSACDEGELQASAVEKYWLEHYVTGGGFISEDGVKFVTRGKKTIDITYEKARISFGGNVGYLPEGDLVGNWQVNFHDVADNNFDFDKGKFHSTEFTELKFTYREECGDPAPPEASYNIAKFKADGKFNGEEGWSIWLRTSDQGEPGKDNDAIRITLSGPNGESYDTFDSGDFLDSDGDEGDCPGSRKTDLSGGNLQIHPPVIPEI